MFSNACELCKRVHFIHNTSPATSSRARLLGDRGGTVTGLDVLGNWRPWGSILTSTQLLFIAPSLSLSLSACSVTQPHYRMSPDSADYSPRQMWHFHNLTDGSWGFHCVMQLYITYPQWWSVMAYVWWILTVGRWQLRIHVISFCVFHRCTNWKTFLQLNHGKD